MAGSLTENLLSPDDQLWSIQRAVTEQFLGLGPGDYISLAWDPYLHAYVFKVSVVKDKRRLLVISRLEWELERMRKDVIKDEQG